MHRPIGVTILAALSLLAAIPTAIHTLQYLGLLPFVIGDRTFYNVEWLAAVLWAINTLIYVVVAFGLWNLRPWAWLYTVLISAFNLILAAVALLGRATLGDELPSIVISAIILVYCLSSGVREAFATGGARA